MVVRWQRSGGVEVGGGEDGGVAVGWRWSGGGGGGRGLAESGLEVERAVEWRWGDGGVAEVEVAVEWRRWLWRWSSGGGVDGGGGVLVQWWAPQVGG